MFVVSRRRVVVALALVAVLAGGACGTSTTKTKAGTKLTSLGKTLPKAIRDSGVIKVGSDIEYPPVESYKEGTKQDEGLDVDIANAIGEKLGVRLRFMNDTAERRGKGVDFIDYFRAGTSIIAKKGNPQGLNTLDDLCGKTVAVQKGTIQETDILDPQQPKCTAAGRSKINVLTFEKDTDALEQVKTGRAVANLEDFPVAAYNAKISGGGNDFQAIDVPGIGPGNYGIAVLKTNTQLRDALQAALKAVIADGTYDHILAKWNV